MRVAFLGPQATYTHQAALKWCKQQNSIAKLEPKTTIGDVFTAVQRGEVDKGIVPFENSSNGSVVFTLDLFADLKGSNPDLIITDEVYLPVQHCLVGWRRYDQSSKDTTWISTSMTNGTFNNDDRRINKLYSHPQAWGQCTVFLDTYLPGVEREDASSTSRGAEIVAYEGPSSASAAISSRLAAELHGLEVLAPGIEDRKGNTTRFFVLQRLDAVKLITRPELKTLDQATWKTMITFAIEPTTPAALADALAVFQQHDLSLININTRPSGQQRWTYMFFVEFRGQKNSDLPDNHVDAALEVIQATTVSYRWLGSWQGAPEDD